MENAVELINVCKEYGTGDSKFKAVCDVNLKIKHSEFVAIMGPSGSGKSTMLHLIGGLDRPTAGKVLIGGKDVSKLDDNELARLRREKIGFIFQFFNMIPSFTSLENVELPMVFTNVSDREERAKKLLKSVGLEKRIHHLPSQMSGGEIQRVAIARALSNKPPIILADEPTGNLDSKSGKEVMKILKSLNEDMGVTLLIITHDKSIAEYAQRTVMLKDGKLIG